MRPVFLMGLMGSGKSYLGKKLAGKLSLDFIDLDELIEQKESMTIPEIFEKYGEAKFRELEQKYLRELIPKEGVVIALGGGTPCNPDTIKLLNECGETVYLQVDIDVLVERLKDQTDHRPLLKDKSPLEIKDLLVKMKAVREPFYVQAKYRIDAGNLNEERIDQIVRQLGYTDK